MENSSPSNQNQKSFFKREQGGLPIWLLWLSNLSQFGLLLTAVIVYVYTVIPAYKVGVLEEEIAKRTIELKKLEAAVDESYVIIRANALKNFISIAGAKCSGLLIPPPPVSERGKPVINEESMAEKILAIDPTSCLMDTLLNTKASKDLRQQDLEKLKIKIGKLGKNLEEKRVSARTSYLNFPKMAEKDPSLLKPLGPFTDAALRLPMDPKVRENLRKKHAIEEGQFRIVISYGEEVRDNLLELNAYDWN